ncbi:VirK/YbjX family protein [Avibacterium paragallinarum]|uniref:VirK/YbjX family protein n=1 Tax=Avibacterium paragallinarum TaxID=728 RepID=UPI00021AD1D2|nr:DUF535 family protein [Avibacterium paragallinarum]QIR12443.1 DUF535 family protein [Avibacterium paragallinarum]QJE10603.1 DUF535 family protein [Avibacterium paragallinarum]QJE12797.1 DUF535 family protein [Avibacterium paragallinarum]QJE14998.1 DUF535 family protein [Avibacterium paragallinarum]QJE17198.1 DUF535 family protein [Avibacterium paragallinarum]
MTTPDYQWPKPVLLYPDRNNKSYRLKRLRYRLRSWLHFNYIKKFEHFVNQQPWLINLLESRADWSYPIAHRFLDKRFTRKQRFVAVCDNLQFLPIELAKLGIAPLWERPISFGEVIPDFELILTLTTHQPMEGYWTFELIHKPTNELIYLLTFGKVEDALLIAVVQGPNCEGSKDIVKQLTKQCYGLRPAYLMVEVMKIFTQVLGYKRLLGIPQKYQNKSRFVRASRYIVDYDVIFKESGGVLKEYWQLPIGIEMKDLETVSSNKRSMYRKRYAMLQNIQQVFYQVLNVKNNDSLSLK